VEIVYDTMANSLADFGGHLECESCGRVEPFGGIAVKLAHGWPECCGYTMRWWTQKELVEREAATK